MPALVLLLLLWQMQLLVMVALQLEVLLLWMGLLQLGLPGLGLLQLGCLGWGLHGLWPGVGWGAAAVGVFPHAKKMPAGNDAQYGMEHDGHDLRVVRLISWQYVMLHAHWHAYQ